MINWKWDFCLHCRGKKLIPHSLKPWTHHWLGLHLCGMMQMMTNSFIPHHECVANRCNTLGWVLLGTWLRGWAAWLNHSEESCYQSAVKPLSQPSPLARAFVHLYSDVALTSLLGYVCDDGSTLFQFVTKWMCQCHFCQRLTEDCAFDMFLAWRQSDGRCHLYVPNPKIFIILIIPQVSALPTNKKYIQ